MAMPIETPKKNLFSDFVHGLLGCGGPETDVELDGGKYGETVKKPPVHAFSGNVTVPAGAALTLEKGATINDGAGALGGSQKTVVEIMPDNSCSMSFGEVYDLVENGNAAFSLPSVGAVGVPIQASWTMSKNIQGVIQSAIEAHILVVTETALKVRHLIWGEKSGISVASKTLSFS